MHMFPYQSYEVRLGSDLNPSVQSFISVWVCPTLGLELRQTERETKRDTHRDFVYLCAYLCTGRNTAKGTETQKQEGTEWS
jgi:hypothetical protein